MNVSCQLFEASAVDTKTWLKYIIGYDRQCVEASAGKIPWDFLSCTAYVAIGELHKSATSV